MSVDVFCSRSADAAGTLRMSGRGVGLRCLDGRVRQCRRGAS